MMLTLNTSNVLFYIKQTIVLFQRTIQTTLSNLKIIYL